MSALVLIDYYNLPAEITRYGVAHLWSRLRAFILAEIGDGETDIILRLYGGWYDESGLSRDGDVVARDIDRNFPDLIRRSSDARIQRVHCELASSLYKIRDRIFPATVRIRRGLKHAFKTQDSISCAQPDSCSIPLVMRWLNGRCPGPQCSVNTRAVFRYREQKLVDTLMCCDLISVAVDTPSTPTIVVSEDDDFVPAMLLAIHLGGSICHLRTTAGRRGIYDDILVQVGIRTIAIK